MADLGLWVLFYKLADGSYQLVVLFWTLGGYSEEVVGESCKVEAVADEHAVLMDEVVLQVGAGQLLCLAEHEVGFGLEDTDALYLAQVSTQTCRFRKQGCEVRNGRRLAL